MRSTHRRVLRPLLSTAGVAAALFASACGPQISDESAEQHDVIGDIAVTTHQCLDSPIFRDGGTPRGEICSTGIPAPTPPIEIIPPYEEPPYEEVPYEEVPELTLPSDKAYRAARGRGMDAQLLLAYQIPATSKAPERFALVEKNTDDPRPAEYLADEAYTASLTSKYAPEEGTRWVGYMSTNVEAAYLSAPQWSSTARFTLPTAEAGQPFRGPFAYRTVVGYRENSDAEDAERPLNCDEKYTRCETDRTGFPAESTITRSTRANRAIPAGAPTIQTRDLAVAAGSATPVNIAQGQSGDVGFVVRYAGAASPEKFDFISGTPLVGAITTPITPGFKPDGDAEAALPVRVQVPAGAPLGVQNVELIARLVNGQVRRATAQYNVVVPAAPAAPAAVTSASSSSIIAPAPKSCASRRSFSIRLRQRTSDPLVSAVVRVNGKKVQTIKKGRLTATVKLTGLPKGRFTVKITAKTRSGKTVTGVRKYRTCAPKLDGGTPEL